MATADHWIAEPEQKIEMEWGTMGEKIAKQHPMIETEQFGAKVVKKGK